MGEPDLGVLRLQQPGPQSGDLGAAGAGRRSEIRRLAAAAQRALPQIRRADRAQGHLCRQSRPPRRGVAGSAGLDHAGRARGQDRPERAAPAAAHHAGAGEEIHLDPGQGRSRGRQRVARYGEGSAERRAAWQPELSMATTAARIESVRASAYVVPTDRPEADGTFAWTSTTLILAQASAGGQTGLGYTYADRSITTLIAGPLGEVVKQHDALDTGAAWIAMQRRVRNLGRQGLAACAISAVDAALWDLKAKLLGLPL